MDEVSRAEFDMLRQMVTATQGRLENIDDHGTRGITALTAQVTEIVKDVAALQSELTSKFEAHVRLHEQDHRERISGRRWLIGTGFAGIGAMCAVIALLTEVLSRIH